MARYETSVEVSAPLETVWQVLTDVTRWPEWTASTRRVELLDNAPLRVGSRVVIRQPRLPAMLWRVTELEPPRSFTWVSTRGGVTTTAEHRLSEGAGGVVTVRLSVDQSGPLARVAALLAGRMTRRYVGMEARGLKRACEERGAAPA